MHSRATASLLKGVSFTVRLFASTRRTGDPASHGASSSSSSLFTPTAAASLYRVAPAGFQSFVSCDKPRHSRGFHATGESDSILLSLSSPVHRSNEG